MPQWTWEQLWVMVGGAPPPDLPLVIWCFVFCVGPESDLRRWWGGGGGGVSVSGRQGVRSSPSARDAERSGQLPMSESPGKQEMAKRHTRSCRRALAWVTVSPPLGVARTRLPAPDGKRCQTPGRCYRLVRQPCEVWGRWWDLWWKTGKVKRPRDLDRARINCKGWRTETSNLSQYQLQTDEENREKPADSSYLEPALSSPQCKDIQWTVWKPQQLLGCVVCAPVPRRKAFWATDVATAFGNWDELAVRIPLRHQLPFGRVWPTSAVTVWTRPSLEAVLKRG